LLPSLGFWEKKEKILAEGKKKEAIAVTSWQVATDTATGSASEAGYLFLSVAIQQDCP
jgi:hypothetical protein